MSQYHSDCASQRRPLHLIDSKMGNSCWHITATHPPYETNFNPIFALLWWCAESTISSRPLHGDNAVNHNQQKVKIKIEKKITKICLPRRSVLSPQGNEKLNDFFFHWNSVWDRALSKSYHNFGSELQKGNANEKKKNASSARFKFKL